MRRLFVPLAVGAALALVWLLVGERPDAPHLPAGAPDASPARA